MVVADPMRVTGRVPIRYLLAGPSGDLPLLRWALGLWRSLALAWLLRRPAPLRWARGLWRSLALTLR